MRSSRNTVYRGSLVDISEIADVIIRSKKYTPVFLKKKDEELKIQGEEFPSRTGTVHYEVYPDLVISPIMDMKATDFWKWVWGDLVCIRIDITCNSVLNKGRIEIHGKNGVVQSLCKGIEGFSEALAKVSRDEDR